MANAARDTERRQQTFAFADIRKWALSEHGLPLVGFARGISSATEYDETFMGRQNGGAIKETAIRRFRAANRKEK